MTTRASLPPLQSSDFTSAFPQSRKVYVEERGVRVPMREISLSNGESLRVYDASGPQGHDVGEGLPPLRREWIEHRGGVVSVDRSYRPSSADVRPMPPSLAARMRT